MVATISRDELKAKVDAREPFVLVETLAPEAYAEGHLPRAVNMPPGRLSELAPELLPDKAAEIIVYCSKPA